MTDGAILWIKSLDVTWYSSIYGLQFLVGQGYSVLALGILSVILLSRLQADQELFCELTEQPDLNAKFGFRLRLHDAEYLSLLRGSS